MKPLFERLKEMVFPKSTRVKPQGFFDGKSYEEEKYKKNSNNPQSQSDKKRTE